MCAPDDGNDAQQAKGALAFLSILGRLSWLLCLGFDGVERGSVMLDRQTETLVEQLC